MNNDIEEYYGDVKLRWYQKAVKNQLLHEIKSGFKRILICQPTGAGKTISIAAALSDEHIKNALNVIGRDINILFVAHKHRLLSQADQTFIKDSGVNLILQSAFSEIPSNILKEGWDVCIIDECHHEAMQSLQLKLDVLSTTPIIGLTATPDRADGCLIKFEKIISPISREQAVEQGYLAETELYSFVDVGGGNKVQILKDILTNYNHLMGQTMIFVRTKKEVREINKFINEKLGLSSIPILDQKDSEVDQILNDFSEKRSQFIVNCNKINEGVDVRGCVSVLLGRQFGSYPQLNQVIGRASRPDSKCKVWELINPLSGSNLDTTVVVGTPKSHKLFWKEKSQWIERNFNYVY